MDARDWDRIADLLMQIRAKYSKQETTDTNHEEMLTWAILTIDQILKMNHKLADWDANGWI